MGGWWEEGGGCEKMEKRAENEIDGKKEFGGRRNKMIFINKFIGEILDMKLRELFLSGK